MSCCEGLGAEGHPLPSYPCTLPLSLLHCLISPTHPHPVSFFIYLPLCITGSPPGIGRCLNCARPCTCALSVCLFFSLFVSLCVSLFFSSCSCVYCAGAGTLVFIGSGDWLSSKSENPRLALFGLAQRGSAFFEAALEHCIYGPWTLPALCPCIYCIYTFVNWE